MPDRPRPGFLYPGSRADTGAPIPQAEGDYPLAQSIIEPPVALELVVTRVQEDAHREDALRQTGHPDPLREGAAELCSRGVAAIMWACTSGSFVFGLAGAREQARDLADFAGVPASSTSLAFLDACRHVGARRVAVAATYPDDVVDLLQRFLQDGGVDVVARTGAGIITGVEVGTLDAGSVMRMVTAADHPDADAILVPDTALHSIGLLDELDAAVGKPVLTANQVSIWKALRMVGHPASQSGMGRLFAVGRTTS